MPNPAYQVWLANKSEAAPGSLLKFLDLALRLFGLTLIHPQASQPSGHFGSWFNVKVWKLILAFVLPSQRRIFRLDENDVVAFNQLA